MSSEKCVLHFPRWMIQRGDVVTDILNIVNTLDSVPDIAQREDSGGPRPVASWSHCEGGQYLTSYVSL